VGERGKDQLKLSMQPNVHGGGGDGKGTRNGSQATRSREKRKKGGPVRNRRVALKKVQQKGHRTKRWKIALLSNRLTEGQSGFRKVRKDKNNCPDSERLWGERGGRKESHKEPKNNSSRDT